MSRTVNAREAALEALGRCRRDGSWSGAAIDSAIRRYALDRREAAQSETPCRADARGTCA